VNYEHGKNFAEISDNFSMYRSVKTNCAGLSK